MTTSEPTITPIENGPYRLVDPDGATADEIATVIAMCPLWSAELHT